MEKKTKLNLRILLGGMGNVDPRHVDGRIEMVQRKKKEVKT